MDRIFTFLPNLNAMNDLDGSAGTSETDVFNPHDPHLFRSEVSALGALEQTSGQRCDGLDGIVLMVVVGVESSSMTSSRLPPGRE